MATRSKKPKCDGTTSQSCGMGCISREHTCREMVAADVATRLIAVAKQHQQPSDAAGQGFDSIAANFPPKLLAKAHKTGVATSDLGSGATLTTKVATGLDGSTIKYGFVTDADGARYTVSDGRVKEVTAAIGSEWQEAFDAAVRSKVAMTKSDNPADFTSSLDLGLVSDTARLLRTDTVKAAKIEAVVGNPPGGLGLTEWISSNYAKLSPYVRGQGDDPGLREMAKSAVQAIAKLPQLNIASVNSARPSTSWPELTEDKMQKLNRFSDLDESVLVRYKTGAVVKEEGVFATSYMTEYEMPTFAKQANTHFIVQAKASSETSAKGLDEYKGNMFEGEIAYAPGASFKVLKVEDKRLDFNKGFLSKSLNSLEPVDFDKVVGAIDIKYPGTTVFLDALKGKTLAETKQLLSDSSLDLFDIDYGQDIPEKSKSIPIKLKHRRYTEIVEGAHLRITLQEV